MPPQPLFSSTRAQSTAVAVLAGTLLLAATGVAKIQAGDRPAYLNTPTERIYRLTRPQQTDARQTILIDTPANWQLARDDPNRIMLTDPSRPTRGITLSSSGLNEPAAAALSSPQFFMRQIDPVSRATFEPVTQPFGFMLGDTGLSGAQLVGLSQEEDGRIRQHLLACLMHGGSDIWWVYLTDVVEHDEDADAVLHANVRMLQTMYRSAHVDREPHDLPQE